MTLIGRHETLPHPQYMTLSNWKRRVRELLPRREAMLLIELYEKYTVISPAWFDRLSPSKKLEILELTRKAIRLGLLDYYRFNFPEGVAEGATFPIRKNQGEKNR